MSFPRFSRAVRIAVLTGLLVALSGCNKPLRYVETAVADRRANVLGLETLFLRYLDDHPEQFPIFVRILTDADNALQSHRFLTRASVSRWIDRRAAHEGLDGQRVPGVFFLKRVYLAGWNRGYLHVLDEDDRELLADLITGVMGALHKCQTCTTAGPH